MLREFQRIFLENLLARFAEKLGAWTKCVRLVNLQHCNSRTCAAAKDSTPSSKRNQRQLITVTLRIRFFFFSGAMASMATSMLCLCVWWEAPESSLGSMFQENCRFLIRRIYDQGIFKRKANAQCTSWISATWKDPKNIGWTGMFIHNHYNTHNYFTLSRSWLKGIAWYRS